MLEGRTPLQAFADEAGALQALPALPFELARWARPNVAPDAHAQVGKTLYSVPWRLIGKHLDARATAQVVQFYSDGELVKTHPAQARGRRTDWADLPEEKVGFFMRNPAWCAAQAVVHGAQARPAGGAASEHSLSAGTAMWSVFGTTDDNDEEEGQ